MMGPPDNWQEWNKREWERFSPNKSYGNPVCFIWFAMSVLEWLFNWHELANGATSDFISSVTSNVSQTFPWKTHQFRACNGNALVQRMRAVARKSFGIFHRYQIPISYQWPLSISDEIEIQFSALNSWPVHFGSNLKLSRIGERLWNELCADIN